MRGLVTVDPDSKDTYDGRTPLSMAAGNGHETVVKLPLERRVSMHNQGINMPVRRCCGRQGMDTRQ